MLGDTRGTMVSDLRDIIGYLHTGTMVSARDNG